MFSCSCRNAWPPCGSGGGATRGLGTWHACDPRSHHRICWCFLACTLSPYRLPWPWDFPLPASCWNLKKKKIPDLGVCTPGFEFWTEESQIIWTQRGRGCFLPRDGRSLASGTFSRSAGCLWLAAATARVGPISAWTSRPSHLSTLDAEAT